MTKSRTVSLQVTDSEYKTIAMAARQAGERGLSRSAWIKARVAAAIVDARALGLAQRDIAALARRGTHNRARAARVSVVLPAALHAELGLHAHAIGVTVHDLLQGVAVMSGERELGQALEQPARMKALPDMRPGQARLIDSLWRAYMVALESDTSTTQPWHVGLAVCRLTREKVMRYDYGRVSSDIKHFDDMPRDYRDKICTLAGWLGFKPRKLYQICARAATAIETRREQQVIDNRREAARPQHRD